MASTTAARDDSWRSIDIDRFDPDSAVNFDLGSFTPDVVAGSVSVGEVQELVGAIRATARAGKPAAALQQALENVPYGADAKGKELYLSLMLDTLQAIRHTEVVNTLQELYTANVVHLDTLMKFLYRGMAIPAPSASSAAGTPLVPTATGTSSSTAPPAFAGGRSFQTEGSGQLMSVILSWHEKVVEIAGLGCISRVMTDRRTV